MGVAPVHVVAAVVMHVPLVLPAVTAPSLPTHPPCWLVAA